VKWLSQNIDEATRDDFDAVQLLESAHGVPFKVVEDLQGDYFFQYQNWQNLLLEIALNPSKATETEIFDGNELQVLNCLQQLVTEGIRLKAIKHEGAQLELNRIIMKTPTNYLFKLLDDISRAISMSQTTVNMKLLLDNILIVWSHITHLKQYPIIINSQDI
jgi:DNA polymerase-3 subunit delta'